MIQSLDLNKEYLVPFNITQLEISDTIVNLKNMRNLLKGSTPYSATDPHFPNSHKWKRYLSDELENCYITVFVISPDLFVPAWVWAPGSGDRRWALDLSICDGPVADYQPYDSPLVKVRRNFEDLTIPNLQNNIPIMNKFCAVAAINRWINLLDTPLSQDDPEEPPESAMISAKNFVGSVAALAVQQMIDYPSSGNPDIPELEYFKVRATFPTQSLSAELSIVGWGHTYNCLSDKAAAIYSCALPRIIQVHSTYSETEDESHDVGEHSAHYIRTGIRFVEWTSPDLPFEPSTAIDRVLSQLPRMPNNAIIPPARLKGRRL